MKANLKTPGFRPTEVKQGITWLTLWVVTGLFNPVQAADQAAPAAASSLGASVSASSHPVWVNAGYYSFHTDNQVGLRNANIGLGLEVRLDEAWAATAGRFMNSDSVHSNYVGAYYRPWRLAGGQVGVLGGLINGYKNALAGGWFPALVPVATWETGMLGLNVAFVPPIKNQLYGSISFQAKLRVNGYFSGESAAPP